MELAPKYCWIKARVSCNIMSHIYLPFRSTVISHLWLPGMWCFLVFYLCTKNGLVCCFSHWLVLGSETELICFSSCRNLNPRELTDAVDFESDCWSDDSTSDELSRSLSNNSNRTWDTISEDLSIDHEGSLLTKDRFGYLYLHYCEISSPCWRVPLMEKVNVFSFWFVLLTLCESVDSWTK